MKNICGIEGLTPQLAFAISASAIGAGFQHGYHTGVVNMPQALVEAFIRDAHMRNYNKIADRHLVTVIFSIVVSIFCLGGMLGAFLTVYLAKKFGSRGGLLISNALVFVACALLGFSRMARTYEMLIVGRFVIGINSGLNAGLCPMYLSEISPVQLRGAIGTIYQLVIVISILVSQILGLSEVLGTEELWPVLFAMAIVPAIFMFATLPFCSKSPKYLLITRGNDEEAHEALKWLRGTDDVEIELEIIRAENEEIQSIPQVNLKDILTESYLRRPLVIAVVIMLSQQLTGINAVIYYSTSIFMTAGFSRQNAVYLTLGMGLVNFLMTIVSMLLVERAGRKSLYLTGIGGTAILTVLLTISMALTRMESELSYLSIACVFLFIVFFAIGPGPIPWFIVSELFGQGARPLATSIAVAVNWLANFTVGLLFLPISDFIKEYTFLIFAAFLVIFFIFTYIEVPETRGKTIEEITAIFKETESS